MQHSKATRSPWICGSLPKGLKVNVYFLGMPCVRHKKCDALQVVSCAGRSPRNSPSLADLPLCSSSTSDLLDNNERSVEAQLVSRRCKCPSCRGDTSAPPITPHHLATTIFLSEIQLAPSLCQCAQKIVSAGVRCVSRCPRRQ